MLAKSNSNILNMKSVKRYFFAPSLDPGSIARQESGEHTFIIISILIPKISEEISECRIF